MDHCFACAAGSASEGMNSQPYSRQTVEVGRLRVQDRFGANLFRRESDIGAERILASRPFSLNSRAATLQLDREDALGL